MGRKGQVIGGAAPRRGMLPPSGAAPVEVTPEWLREHATPAGPVLEKKPAGPVLEEKPAGPVLEEKPAGPVLEEKPAEPAQQERPAGAGVAQEEKQPPAVRETHAADLPDPSADPADQLAVCERHIHEAKARWKRAVDGATEEFIDAAGPFLAWVHEHKLYKMMRGNDGKPYRSFAKYLKEQHDLTRRTGYRIVQTIPLLKLLADNGHPLPDLSARQVDVLHPLRKQHGDAAVVKVWATATETKKGPIPTPDELEKAQALLGLKTAPEEPDEEPKSLAAGSDPGSAVERAAKLLVPETVREAVRTDPDRVRLLHQLLGKALEEAGVSPTD